MRVRTSKPDMPGISRALARHDPATVYTLLAECYPAGVAGRMLRELVKTVPDWPKPSDREVTYDQRLVKRELEVLRCAERGLTTVGTARELIVGAETVKTHRHHILIKLGAKNMHEAVFIARELGLL